MALSGFAERLASLIGERTSVSQVADDPVLTAELLLLVRMGFADHEVNAPEAAAFRAICTRALGLDGDELGDIIRFLDSFGYETSSAQAAEMLRDLPEKRRREIMDHLATMARADGTVTDSERALFHATARRLGLE
ncbi:TerB family tellurite resistance protein [Pseudohoeflea coraliihabitans]|uniref:TerB family tellurite resistance protein n=1 Tax=Pseudohoeflea coraliihabitans TaxID=2860393 RepID=A0ABS6WIX7_9HYPH|nr:TerB family tellurite resistance protein [Pseudohoeflea sp. DP4N28-3]MBW3095750.1 TerB family tellurite resistance protein [Pseudohoeflea sp. DP4N28-3]